VSNVFGRAGPGLGTTLLAPWSAVGFQLGQLRVHLQLIQSAVYAFALVSATAAGWNDRPSRHFAYHVWASWALLIFFAGKHPTLGYYAYPAALSSIALGMMASQVMRRIARLVARHSPRPLGVLPWVVPVLLLSAFLPGGGLRTIW